MKLNIVKRGIIFKTFLILMLGFVGHGKEKNFSVNHLKKNIRKFRKANTKKLLYRFLKETRPSRMIGSEGHEKAKYFIRNYLQAIKVENQKSKSRDTDKKYSIDIQKFKAKTEVSKKMYEKDFQDQIVKKIKKNDPEYIKWKNFTSDVIKNLNKHEKIMGENIIWEQKGYDKSKNAILTIGAHFDTLVNDKKSKLILANAEQPGADDNASGVIIALLLAKFLSQFDFPYTFRIVFFDWQEFGYLGSFHYVSQLTPKEISNSVGFLNLEMLGYDSKLNDLDKKLGNFKAYIRKKENTEYKKDYRLITNILEKARKFNRSVNFEVKHNSFNASDHLYFWKRGIPAVTFTQNWERDFNPNHHSASDSGEIVNFKTLHNVFEALSGGLALFLNDDKYNN